MVTRKSRLGWVQTHMSYFLDSGPKFTRLVWLNAGGIARDHISFTVLISCLFPEIFAIQVGCCENRSKFCMFLAPRIYGLALSDRRRYRSRGKVSSRSAEETLEILWLIKNRLEIGKWSRAQHEATRRPTSDLKNILGVVWCVKI